jgi:TetR/AcrR family transcriptional repressor of nem operon
MSTPLNTTKNELLHEASRMLLAKGLNGFSLQELAEKLQIKKSSLFHHYPSKMALALELYRFYQSSFTAWVDEHQHLSSEKQIIAYTEKLTSWICEKQRVCPVGALSLEWHLVDPKLQVEIKKLHELQKSWLTDMYKDIQKQTGLRLSVNDAVLGTMSLIQGSIQLARLNNDSSIMKKNLKAYLKCIKE